MIRLVTLLALCAAALSADAPRGYYRSPAIHGNEIVFTAEGDLWKVSTAGGVAQRLTTHAEQETGASISPDGATLAFNASYEGPVEIYTMPVEGGLPTRRTWEGGTARVRGWMPGGRLIYVTTIDSTLPSAQLVTLDLKSGVRERIPLAQADQAVYDPSTSTFFFTRLPKQSSNTKRYKGGTIQQLWKYAAGGAEAVPLTADYPGTSRDPMWWKGRVYFASDRDGTMNIWSMRPDGTGLKQHTRHSGWDALSAAQDSGRIVYQLGADIYLFDVATEKTQQLDIRLASDLDQLRETWEEEPFQYLSDIHVSPSGDRVALTSRGRVFVAPAKQGRFVEIARDQGVRYRDAKFSTDGKSLLAMSDQSGEVEFWKLPADGIGDSEQLTTNGDILRWRGELSPDGKWLAHDDKNRRLWLLNMETKEQKLIRESPYGFGGSEFGRYRWSPDSRWLAFSQAAANTFEQIFLYDRQDETFTELTSDRYNSSSPAWSPDGKWMYFVSDRSLESSVPSPWGPRQPEPYFDKADQIYHLPLRTGLRSPFRPDDELYEAPKEDESKSKEDKSKGEDGEDGDDKEKAPDPVVIDLDGIAERLLPVPVPPGNYTELSLTGKTLYWLSATSAPGRDEVELMSLEIGNEEKEPESVAAKIESYELSADGKKLLVRQDKPVHVFDADKQPPKDDKERKKLAVDLAKWRFPIDPREELRQMFVDAWRLERDYFYDPGMHGVNWKAIRDRYEPFVSRVTDRAELSDLIAQMVSELSTLHIFVSGGDFREGGDQVSLARLGARLVRDEAAGGYRVEHIYQHDPDLPEHASPLARQGVDVRAGDIVVAVNGEKALGRPDIGAFLRDQAERQLRLRIRPAGGDGERDVIVRPITAAQDADLRYEEWQYTRRLEVDKLSGGRIGYVHLRAMGSQNISEWARQFYPVFNREGLIIDVRHNRGGNIDSWLLGKLLRKSWFFWQPRGGAPQWNMQYAFDGHMVSLIDERTASDGEAFAEGFRRLGLGKLLGTRTWGGEIWLSSSNRLVDRGVATAGEIGVYGPEREWLIEGHGVEPDIEVDNLPHETFQGKDAQLEAAVRRLLELIEKDPPQRPDRPQYPDKSFDYQ